MEYTFARCGILLRFFHILNSNGYVSLRIACGKFGNPPALDVNPPALDVNPPDSPRAGVAGSGRAPV
eukprot:1361845-Pyramimonas_sp.AAC.2